MTKQNKLHQTYHCFIKVDHGRNVPEINLFGVLYSNAFVTSTTCENA